MFLFYLENDLNDLMLAFFPVTLSCHVIFFVSSSSVMSHVIYSVRAACLSPRDISFWRLIFTQFIFCVSIDQGISFLFQLWTFLLGNKYVFLILHCLHCHCLSSHPGSFIIFRWRTLPQHIYVIWFVYSLWVLPGFSLNVVCLNISVCLFVLPDGQSWLHSHPFRQQPRHRHVFLLPQRAGGLGAGGWPRVR